MGCTPGNSGFPHVPSQLPTKGNCGGQAQQPVEPNGV